MPSGLPGWPPWRRRGGRTPGRAARPCRTAASSSAVIGASGIEEDPDEPFGFGASQRVLERRERLVSVAGGLVGEGEEQLGFDGAALPPARLGGGEEALEQRDGVGGSAGGEQDPGEGEVLVLAEVAGLVVGGDTGLGRPLLGAARGRPRRGAPGRWWR